VSDLASVHTEIVDGMLVIVAAGELDMSTVPLLENELDVAIGSRDATVVLDLGAVRFCDSSALRTTLHAREQLARRDLSLAVVCVPGGPVERVLQLVGATRQISVYADRAGALAACDAEPRDSART